ncbi:MAG: twin-arginine translocase TatA/TatE family subunit [Deltaproteobacteria bacterium]|nr:twin-arginine translocase TatA/TatE family subunit [Deltaproteobacteria bacterium]
MGFGIGWSEVMMVVLVAVLVIKPERLPEAARFIGKIWGQARNILRQMSLTFEKEVEEIKKLDRPVRSLLNEAEQASGRGILNPAPSAVGRSEDPAEPPCADYPEDFNYPNYPADQEESGSPGVPAALPEPGAKK